VCPHPTHTGDSRVILGKLNEKTGAVVGVTASYRHLPTDQEELERITVRIPCHIFSTTFSVGGRTVK
jgi:hypothetical protein